MAALAKNKKNEILDYLVLISISLSSCSAAVQFKDKLNSEILATERFDSR